ncbi:hypothetical protein ACDX78_00040 [Virgibacillus oceani]
MADKKHYFVTIDTQDIREESVPDGYIEYEITASENEIKELKELFRKKDKNAEAAIEYIGKPFDEWGADEERESYDQFLIGIYERIHALGTADTKSKIEELGII